jgi:hypothetical protein
VELDPLPIGIAPVDYQGVELRGFRDEVGPEVETPFRLNVDTGEIPHGRIGFVLIGATQREYFPAKED